MTVVWFIGSMEAVSRIFCLFVCFKLHSQVGCVELVKVFLYFVRLVLNMTFVLWQSWDFFGNVGFTSSLWGRVWSVCSEEVGWVWMLGRTCPAIRKGCSGKGGPEPGVISSEKAQS